MEPAKISPQDIPDGFKAQDPHNGAAGGDAANAAAQKQAMEEQKQAVLQQALTPDALARLNRIKLVKEAKAKALEASIVNMAMSGRLPGRINEGKLIEMLERGSAREAQGNTGSINIQRKKYAFDSDDEDDDDDV
mmetsp:Transcript_13682/g.37820  ORF Transcript_13682/g.37820 Transcript_13682/m.37820 type:complete len:135 (-) Transcript_13682:222-626(-)